MTTKLANLFRFLFLFCGISVNVATAHEQTLSEFLAANQATDQEVQVDDSAPKFKCNLSIEILEKSTRQPLHGSIRVTDLSTGEFVRLNRILERPMGWYSSSPKARLTVPSGKIRIEAFHGIETEVLEMILDLSGQSERSVKLLLTRFYDPAARRIFSGNTHLHVLLEARRKTGVQLESRKETDQYLRVVGKSDGLDIVYVSYLTRPGSEYITNEYTRNDFRNLSDREILFVNGEEYRHSGGVDSKNDNVTYGHVMFLDIPRLIEPASIGPGLTEDNDATDGVPLRQGIRQVRADGGTVVWCHGMMGTEAVPNWFDGLIHAQNIYDGGNVGTIESVYYPYLNAGLKVPFSSGTDWGIWDFSRVYVPLDGSITSRSFLDSLTQGRSFITNGTFLELDVNGQQPGGTIAIDKPSSVQVRAKAIGRGDFKKLQLVLNGKVIREVARRPEERHFVAELQEAIDVSESGWLALRIPTEGEYRIRARLKGVGTNMLGKTLFAHTSPIYLSIDGREVFRPEAVEKLIANIHESIEQIRTKGAFNSSQDRRAVLNIYENAIVKLHERLQIGEANQ